MRRMGYLRLHSVAHRVTYIQCRRWHDTRAADMNLFGTRVRAGFPGRVSCYSCTRLYGRDRFTRRIDRYRV